MRCQHYRVTVRRGAPLAVRCRRRAQWRLQLVRTWVVCATCLPDVLALRGEPVPVEPV